MTGRFDDQELEKMLLAEVEGMLEEGDVPGAGCALMVDGELVFARGVGWREIERVHRLEDGAQFYIYSLAKSLIATAILQRAGQGQIELESPVQKYLPELPLETTVTIRQLLNHTGGLPDYGGQATYNEALKANPGLAWTPDEFLAATLPGGLSYPPGHGWGYSNIGYLLLRQVLEGFTGGSLGTALEEAIFRPTGLRGIFFTRELADAAVLNPGYSSFFSPDGSLEDISRRYHPGWVSHGVVISTAGDTAQIFDRIFNGLVPENLLAEMLTPVRVPVKHPLFREPSYGLGMMIDPASPFGLMAGHGGGGPGYSAGALVLPDAGGRRVTAAAITNQDEPALGLDIAYRLASRTAERILAG